MTNEILLSAQLPVLALRGLVVFPGMLAHFDVGREKSVLALDEAMSHGQEIFLVTQKDISVDDPALDGLYDVGCVCHIRQMLKLPGDTVRILSGLFENFSGRVVSINEQTQTINVVVQMFKQETPVELKFDEVVREE